MKKLFVLFLCLMAIVGFVSAGTVHPPGAQEAALSEYGVGGYAVTPDTVLVMAIPSWGFPDQILVVTDIMATELPQIVFMITGNDAVLPGAIVEAVDYPLRL
jgi:hypothetical protein